MQFKLYRILPIVLALAAICGTPSAKAQTYTFDDSFNQGDDGSFRDDAMNEAGTAARPFYAPDGKILLGTSYFRGVSLAPMGKLNPDQSINNIYSTARGTPGYKWKRGFTGPGSDRYLIVKSNSNPPDPNANYEIKRIDANGNIDPTFQYTTSLGSSGPFFYKSGRANDVGSDPWPQNNLYVQPFLPSGRSILFYTWNSGLDVNALILNDDGTVFEDRHLDDAPDASRDEVVSRAYDEDSAGHLEVMVAEYADIYGLPVQVSNTLYLSNYNLSQGSRHTTIFRQLPFTDMNNYSEFRQPRIIMANEDYFFLVYYRHSEGTNLTTVGPDGYVVERCSRRLRRIDPTFTPYLVQQEFVESIIPTLFDDGSVILSIYSPVLFGNLGTYENTKMVRLSATGQVIKVFPVFQNIHNEPVPGPQGQFMTLTMPNLEIVQYDAAGNEIPRAVLSGGFNNDVLGLDIQPGTSTWAAAGLFSQLNASRVKQLVKGGTNGIDTGFTPPNYYYTAVDFKQNGTMYVRSDRRSFDDEEFKWLRHLPDGSIDPTYPGMEADVLLENGTGVTRARTFVGSSEVYAIRGLTPAGQSLGPVVVGSNQEGTGILQPLRDGSLMAITLATTNTPRAYHLSSTLQVLQSDFVGDSPGYAVGETGYIYSASAEVRCCTVEDFRYYNIKRYKPDLTLDSTFSSTEEGMPFAVLPDLSLLVKRNDSLIRILPNGGRDRSFNIWSSGRISGVKATDDMEYIYFYGSFSNLDGNGASRIGRYVRTGNNPPPSCLKPTVSDTLLKICGSGAVSVTASAESGCALEWRSNAAGTGAPLFTGATYAFTATTSDTLYVRSVCGTGANQCASVPASVIIKVLSGATIANFSPLSGAEGSVVTITGTSLDNVRKLWLGTTPLSFTHVSNTEISFVVPTGSGSGQIRAVTGLNPDTCVAFSSQGFLVAGAVPEASMARTPAPVCDVLYSDPQGSGNYLSNQYITQTLTPSTSGAKLYAELQMLDLADQDQLYVYDDNFPNGARLLAILKACSAQTGKFQATNASGALTFRFYTNSAGTAQGFRFRLTCVTGVITPVPEIVSVTPNRGANGRKVTILGKNLGTVTGLNFNGTASAFTQSGAYLSTTVPVGATTGRISIESSKFVVVSPSDFVVTDTAFQQTTQAVLCSGVFTDPQGAGRDYLPNQYATMTIRPTDAGRKARLIFSEFALGAGDYVYVYNGSSPAAPLLGNYTSATRRPDTLASTSAEGTLTVRFYANGSSEAAGWTASISCLSGTPVSSARTDGGGVSSPGIVVESLSLQPNPAKGKVAVRTQGLDGKPVLVYSTTGKQVFWQAMASGQTESTLDISTLPAGLYLVRCGGQTARLVVE